MILFQSSLRIAATVLLVLCVCNVTVHAAKPEAKDAKSNLAPIIAADLEKMVDAAKKWSDVKEPAAAEPRNPALDDLNDFLRRAKTQGAFASDSEMLDELFEHWSKLDVRIAEVLAISEVLPELRTAPKITWFEASELPPEIKKQVSLYLGREYIESLLFDEANTLLSDLKSEEVVAPVTLLFHQAVAKHQLVEKEAGLKVLARLLTANEKQANLNLPHRYVALANLMQQDLEAVQEKTLARVIRRMDDVERRLDLGRSGKKVQEEEKKIVEALDKKIEELEKQMQQMMQQMAQQQKGPGKQGNQLQPKNHAKDSMPMGGTGPGKIVKKHLIEGERWGNMPPEERDKVLQDVTKTLPAHLQGVIKEYFIKAAEQKK